jgi:hypothetical protein
MARTTRETWAKRVERWRESGQSAAAFAAEIGVSSTALSWWKWHLGKRATLEKASKRSRKEVVSPLTFVEMSAPVRNEPIEIVLPSGVRIRVASNFDAAALGRVLDALGGRQ